MQKKIRELVLFKRRFAKTQSTNKKAHGDRERFLLSCVDCLENWRFPFAKEKRIRFNMSLSI